ncbi:MAG: hypothetical protein O4861_15355 [Trichodesmium sp. St16_bin4-tuft]|nr:hypothetical protein [Trichodesmium sp. MAG_R01]MDE5071863.1 hypothetical protein [Trichodesmium sp. St5_bin8]MDE5091603.1 hypothetical protein [Trichodesmium sp. St18_bin3_1_1]MDE5099627.1 hypothetical protein [Trichodesmium sp. St16_bin4-tuft]MDE5104255.1 hypothetical protein [Trichodesmium sp. St19_bin2]
MIHCHDQDFVDTRLNGLSAGDRIEATRYDFLAWVENIPGGYQAPEGIVEGLKPEYFFKFILLSTLYSLNFI